MRDGELRIEMDRIREAALGTRQALARAFPEVMPPFEETRIRVHAARGRGAATKFAQRELETTCDGGSDLVLDHEDI